MCSSSCSGTVNRTCGICAPPCICSRSRRSSRRIRTPKFLWSHRDPAKVLGSVCSLIAYIRSWSSDRKDPEELGAEQLAWWAEGTRRAMAFRQKFGDERFVDVSFADLQTDPVNTVAAGYQQLGLTLAGSARARVREWADSHN